jgi:Flp pilus assembly protein CpaB
MAAGRTLIAPLAEGEPLTRTRLAPRRAGPVAALVPRGFRALSVASSLPRGSVRRGDRVDLLATFAGGRPHTETVATGLQVLTVLSPDPQSAQAGLGDTAPVADSAGTGTDEALVLLVTPDQAEEVAYAKAFADLTVSVEGPSEDGAS